MRRIVNRLTDAYDKRIGSVFSRVIGIFVSEFEEIRETLTRIEEWRSIDKAEGQTLDDIGVDVGQGRLGLNDADYRILLKARRARDLSGGDTNSIINILSMIFNIDPKEIIIEEKWLDQENPEPAAIKIMMKNDMSLYRVDISSDVVAAGVDVDYELELNQGGGDVKIGVASIFGEVTSVFPYQVRDFESEGSIKVAVGISSELEGVSLYPHVEENRETKGRLRLFLGVGSETEEVSIYPKKEN